MAFTVFTDGSANLPAELLAGIRLLPCSYTVDGIHCCYGGNIDQFDSGKFYQELKEGRVIKTTLLNTCLFKTEFEPLLKEGQDVIYISMSSGISGTFNAARLAAEELEEDFPGRKVYILDSRGCGFGSGLLAVKAEELRQAGLTASETMEKLEAEVPHTCQYFTVDDLGFLKRTGRVSGITAKIGTVLNIKPILYGSAEGEIVSCEKVRGRKAAIAALVRHYAGKVTDAETQTVCISHGDCREDAELLAAQVRAAAPPRKIVIVPHEPFSGSHVGPGMLGLFFRGKER